MSVDVDVFIYFYTNTTFSLVKHSIEEKISSDLSNLMLKQSITNPWKFVWRRLHSAVTAWLGPRHRYPPPLRSGNGGSRETVSLEHLISIPRPGVFVAQSSDRKKAFAKESLSLQLFADFRFGSPNRRINGGNILCSIWIWILFSISQVGINPPAILIPLPYWIV